MPTRTNPQQISECVSQTSEPTTTSEHKNTGHYPLVIIGGGPAGLAAAYESAKRGMRTLVLEEREKVGGIARTEMYKDYLFDVGGHRFLTKDQTIGKLWSDMLGNEFLKISRLTSIYYRGKYFKYPIELLDVIRKMGAVESVIAGLSYLNAKLRPLPAEETFEQWILNRFGSRLYNAFFKTYTEKVWGIPCDKIQAEWASQRIRGLSVISALKNAIFGTNGIKTLSTEFDYPRLGPGMMWEGFKNEVECRGGEMLLNTKVTRFNSANGRIVSVEAHNGKGEYTICGDSFFSSVPLRSLIRLLDPPVPSEVSEAAEKLRYRAFMIVALVVDQPKVFPDNWIYVHSQHVKVGRIQNFKNWSPHMVPDSSRTCLGMEFFCDEGDDLWSMPDKELIALASKELEILGLAKAKDVEDGCVVRQPDAYPVYDPGYREKLLVIRRFLDGIENLQTIGRNGMHRYNNMDHSMLTGILAVRNIVGEKHDLWQVNTDSSYNES
ncbi:MAG TPA: NAD(P)/FAD-dependent oxidoreductase [Syntrophorhabdaceae bacterium]|nr:NAD(P)/FAD-dependent oxidoreductase [Syntrophorhabdaceae bacterium]